MNRVTYTQPNSPFAWALVFGVTALVALGLLLITGVNLGQKQRL